MRTICLALSTLCLCGVSAAQSRDWSSVKALPAGTRIVIVVNRTVLCQVEVVTEDGIACGFRYGSVFFQKPQIKKVKLSGMQRGMALGATLGGAAGLGAGVPMTKDDGAERSGHLIAATGIGVAVGAIVGAVVGASHGPTVYVRP